VHRMEVAVTRTSSNWME